MKSIIFSLFIVGSLFYFLGGCDLINPKSEYSKSYMTFEVEGTKYDTRNWMYEFTNITAILSTRYEKDVISINLQGVNPKADKTNFYPFRMSFSMGTDYEGGQAIQIIPDRAVADGDSIALPFTIFEGISDVLTQVYRSDENPTNQMTLRFADTLGSRYVIGNLESYMVKERLDRKSAFPDTFMLERGHFLVELEDLRE